MSTKAVITMFTAAACVATAGLYGVEVPAIAQPMRPLPLVPSNDCDWQVFATDSDINQGNGTVVHIAWGLGGGGTASYSSQGHDWQGPVTGTVPLKGTNELEFSVPFFVQGTSEGSQAAAATNTYSGSIDQNTGASGTWHNNSGASGTWTMGPTFKCIAHAPAAASAPQPQQAPQQPAETAPVTNAIVLLFSPPKIGSITATVSNSSDLTAQCTYDATPFGEQRDFTVGPKTNTSLTFNGLNTGTSYHVVVSCHDASGKQTQEIGHVEKDVTF